MKYRKSDKHLAMTQKNFCNNFGAISEYPTIYLQISERFRTRYIEMISEMQMRWTTETVKRSTWMRCMIELDFVFMLSRHN